MYNMLIKRYVEKMKLEDITLYCLNNNIDITNDEANVLLSYIKNYWQVVLNGDPTQVFLSIKPKLRPNTYSKMIELYNEYKNKIK